MDKKYTVEKFAWFLNKLQAEGQITKCQFTVITNFGHVYCEVCDSSEPSSDSEKITLEALKFIGESAKRLPKNNGNSQIVTLKNVTIKPFTNPNLAVNYKVLVLFVDQIVGITFGYI